MIAKAAPARPKGVTVIAVVNSVAAVLHLLFWSMAFMRLSTPAQATDSLPTASLPFTYGFGIADLLWSVPFLATSGAGLWRMRDWGWIAAQLANALYCYSLTVILVRDVLSGSVSPGTVVFLPFGVIAVWAGGYLWLRRGLFWGEASEAQQS